MLADMVPVYVGYGSAMRVHIFVRPDPPMLSVSLCRPFFLRIVLSGSLITSNYSRSPFHCAACLGYAIDRVGTDVSITTERECA